MNKDEGRSRAYQGGAAPWVGSPLALVVTNEGSGQLGQDKGSYCQFDDST